MTEEQEKQLNENTAEIIKLLPKKNASQKAKIMAFEAINETYALDGLDKLVYENGHSSFKELDSFFKEVHGYIRAKAVKSKLFRINLEAALLNNYKDENDLFSKKEGITAYNQLLDYYDPNTNNLSQDENAERKFGTWSGFWSLIDTKDGVITGVYLSDTMDRDIFYAAIQRMRMDVIVKEATNAHTVGQIVEENKEDAANEENSSNGLTEEENTEEEKEEEKEEERPAKKVFIDKVRD